MNSAGVQVQRGGDLPVRTLHLPQHVPAGRLISLGGQVRNISYVTRRLAPLVADPPDVHLPIGKMSPFEIGFFTFS